MKNIILILFLTFLTSCNDKSEIKNTNLQIEAFQEKVLKNPFLKNPFEKAFDINSKNKIFKVILSRRYNFLRITIFQIFNLEEIENDLPNDFFIYKDQIFLMYNGSDILYKNYKNLEDIKKVFLL